MSYLTETATLEYDTSGTNHGTYDYHLPHTKTIDLIGEEFAPKRSQQQEQQPSVIVENINPSEPGTINTSNLPITTMSQHLGPNVVFVNTSGGSGVPLQVQQIIQQAQQQGNSQTITLSSLPQSAIVTSSGSSTLLIQPSQEQPSPGTSLPLTPVTVDLPSIGGGNQSTNEESGVLLCNLDDLSKYIPENFYSDFTMADQTGVPDYLQTVVAGKSNTTTTTVSAASASTANGTMVNQQPSTIQLPISMAQTIQTSSVSSQPITIQLPTQPQPVQGVKTVTYVNPVISNARTQPMTTVTSSASLQPLRVTQYAYTQSGERIAIQGLTPEQAKPGSTVQLQVKGGGTQTLQIQGLQGLQGLTVDPSKLTVLQELPEVGKVVIQEARNMGDPITSILEEMKTGHSADETVTLNTGGMEYATAIPVAVQSLASDPKKTTIKRVAAPTSTVFLPGNKTSRNIIFAGNTLPQGAIPIQINGLNAIPLSAVKSLPISISNLTNAGVPTVVSAKRTKVEIIPANAKTITTSLPMVTKVTNNNTGGATVSTAQVQKQAPMHNNQRQQQNTQQINRPMGNNKTCNWVFENGEICGKTFAKSYNLVVHMRMHEDVRPFGCSFCDQTFRQKAHLQRHETTHGVGVKVNRGSSSAQRRKRKRSARSSGGSQGQTTTVVMTTATPNTMSANLQQRLARVSEQFGTQRGTTEDEDETEEEEDLSVNHSGGKSYRRKMSEDKDDLEDESKTTVTVDGSNGNEVFQSSYVDVHDNDLRDEDIIEAVPGTTVVMTTTVGSTAGTTSNVDVVAAAVNEAIKDIEYEAAAAAAASAASDEADNVRVEAQPVSTHANMSPETLTAISGSSSPQPPENSGNPKMIQELFNDEKH